MTSPTEITVNQLSRLIGLPSAPAIVDIRIDEDYALDPRLIPGSRRRNYRETSQWMTDYAGRKVIVICHRGKKLSQGVAALLRCEGIEAETLALGFEGWAAAGLPAIAPEKLPQRDERGRTRWVTRARPKIDRIACPWLIRRFVDPDAAFLFVSPSDVEQVGEKFGAVPFDTEGGFWDHRGEACSFDTLLEEFGLQSDALSRLALIVRGADTARPELAPEAAGLLAASLGLSRMYRDDLEQLSASMGLYDSLYRWCRDATGATHDWPAHRSAMAVQ
ncbi:chromate resistance protein ChrB domain-containing protein [Denitrobaculum tricleocarpae]|uniref:Sulfurtransferase n=1 Tax=Denitrobaculum tricleocarpae TaxID=2591009 RepID=A0A545TKY2_9PROT|nr:sulfurtransferase/chromate resistance protein [Denitrobaculum tricleocarpae]TQV77883.1 sulfurtransferase [Denitrobaculum tricleocarpae]